MKHTTTLIRGRYYDSAITIPTNDLTLAFLGVHRAYGRIHAGDFGTIVVRNSDDGFITFKLNAHGHGRTVLAKETKKYGVSPVRYANQTQAYRAKAKQIHPEKWTVAGNNPYYLARVDFAESLKWTDPGFQASMARIAEVASLSVGEVHEMWARYAEEAENSDQSPILGEFVNWNASDLKPAGMDTPTAKKLLNLAVAA